MNAKRIVELARGARGSTQLRGVAIYALLACTALALALYSCSQLPQQQQPAPPPTLAIAAETPVPITPAPLPMEPAPTPTAVPAFVPLPEDAQFTHIAAGKWHACGLQADGTALCWGRNISGSLELPGGNPSFTRISAGLNFTCGLRIAGAIDCWGLNHLGQASPPDGRFDEITAGHSHACALNDGALICWGGGFPDGAESIQEVPPLSAIQAGFGFTCGLTPDADMACWNRELAITTGPFVDIGIGLHYACAIRVDSSVFCSQKDSEHKHTRIYQPPPTKFVQISVGWHHACGITESSDIECWGSGERGAPGRTAERARRRVHGALHRLAQLLRASPQRTRRLLAAVGCSEPIRTIRSVWRRQVRATDGTLPFAKRRVCSCRAQGHYRGVLHEPNAAPAQNYARSDPQNDMLRRREWNVQRRFGPAV